MSQKNREATVLETLLDIFPMGTVPTGATLNSRIVPRSKRIAKAGPGSSAGFTPEEKAARIQRVPVWPPDAFAAAAYLLEKSGLYPFVMPGSLHIWADPFSTVPKDESEAWKAAAEEWCISKLPDLVQQLWAKLLDEGKDQALRARLRKGEAPPPWLKTAFALAIIADEASANAGYSINPDLLSDKLPWVAAFLDHVDQFILSEGMVPKSGIAEKALTSPSPSITFMANLDLLAVQPKSRTPQVGLTMRTLSHNLALLPPPSEIQTQWRRMSRWNKHESEIGLNLLLVPFPYEIQPEWFETFEELMEDGAIAWGWFDLHQGWLPKPADLNAFVSALIDKSHCPIDGVIFPEYALTWRHHEALVRHLAKNHPEVELVVSGSSSNCEGETGNFELTSAIYRTGKSDTAIGITHTSRLKHHRWRIDKAQIQEYGLERSMDVKRIWWERIEIGQRAINTNVFRQGSSFAVMICEDLARADPVHGPLRSLGPNLVICLLMDGVQIRGRWSARAASGLSEDPGSSVLTFTSRALIARSNAVRARRAGAVNQGSSAANWSIGLWSDSSGRSEEIHCPPEFHAVVLCLDGKGATEHSLDGRPNKDGIAWIYDSAQCLALDESDPALMRLQKAVKSTPKKRSS